MLGLGGMQPTRAVPNAASSGSVTRVRPAGVRLRRVQGREAKERPHGQCRRNRRPSQPAVPDLYCTRSLPASPQGPTLTFRVRSYSLIRDVQAAAARPRVPPNAFKVRGMPARTRAIRVCAAVLRTAGCNWVPVSTCRHMGTFAFAAVLN